MSTTSCAGPSRTEPRALPIRHARATSLIRQPSAADVTVSVQVTCPRPGSVATTAPARFTRRYGASWSTTCSVAASGVDDSTLTVATCSRSPTARSPRPVRSASAAVSRARGAEPATYTSSSSAAVPVANAVLRRSSSPARTSAHEDGAGVSGCGVGAVATAAVGPGGDAPPVGAIGGSGSPDGAPGTGGVVDSTASGAGAGPSSGAAAEVTDQRTSPHPLTPTSPTNRAPGRAGAFSRAAPRLDRTRGGSARACLPIAPA